MGDYDAFKEGVKGYAEDLLRLRRENIITEAAADIAMAQYLQSRVKESTLSAVEALSQQNAFSIHPWKAKQASWKAYTDQADADTNDEALKRMQDIFVGRAKDHCYSETEAMLGQYLFFTKDIGWAINRMRHMFTDLQPQERIACHNWTITGILPEARQHIVGPKIEQLKTPLYPFGFLDELNERLLASDGVEAMEGGAAKNGRSLYRREAHDYEGAGAEPIYDENGRVVLMADKSETEAQLAHLLSVVKGLERKLDTQRGKMTRPRKPQSAYEKQPAWRQPFQGGTSDNDVTPKNA